jgi:hypothetical protein
VGSGALQRARIVYERGRQNADGLYSQWRYGFPPKATGKLPLSEVGFEADDRNGYEPSPRLMLRQMLRRAGVQDSDVFIDLGSGMGHAVIEAARNPFRKIVGVELVPEFTEIAQTVVDRNRTKLRCRNIELVTADLVEYEIPDDVTVAFMSNPVRGPLFEAVVSQLLASIDRNPRRIRLLYFAPRETERLLATGRARLLGYGHRLIRRWVPAEYLAIFELLPASGQPAGAAEALGTDAR